jgi:phosphoglycolate phosphatase-like HAD superfamily hydrolase
MPPLPGTRDLLVAIKERGHRLVLASSGQQRHLDVFLDKLDAAASPMTGLADDWTSGRGWRHRRLRHPGNPAKALGDTPLA